MSYADSTLMSMNKEQLISVIRCLEHNVSVLEERNENQYRLLLEKDRYEWHDIWAHPDDLPPFDEGTVWVILNGKYMGITFVNAPAEAYWMKGDGGFFSRASKNRIVKAWAIPMPFQDEDIPESEEE